MDNLRWIHTVENRFALFPLNNTNQVVAATREEIEELFSSTIVTGVWTRIENRLLYSANIDWRLYFDKMDSKEAIHPAIGEIRFRKFVSSNSLRDASIYILAVWSDGLNSRPLGRLVTSYWVEDKDDFPCWKRKLVQEVNQTVLEQVQF